MPILFILKAIGGTILICLVPGLSLSFFFFRGSDPGWLARITVSVAISIAVTTIVSYLFYLVGVKINASNLLWQILLITSIYPLAYLARRLAKK